ncbi:MAG: alpha-mannosidase [Candidatus Sumerlaeia bacterium]
MRKRKSSYTRRVPEGAYIVHVVSHTHWDRAWYQPFEQFRIRLVRMMDHLLDLLKRKKTFASFMLDGQTVILDDYLEIRPEKLDDLIELVKNKRLFIGPSYVLPDLHLVSGEALIRNLMFGVKDSNRYGQPIKVGYYPDSFGHPTQMPQILQGFEIDSYFFMRGMGDDGEELGSEFYWVAADGQSTVLAIHQVNTYSNARALGVPTGYFLYRKANLDLAFRQAEDQIEKLRHHTNCQILLFNNGLDHYHAQEEIPEVIHYINRRAQGYVLLHSNLADYVKEVQKSAKTLPRWQGEMLSGKYNLILSGVFSTRMYLKQMNARCQNLLEKILEPMATMAWTFGADYPQDEINYAWKLLLRCHPHDDICGCSVDAVHRDDVNRFERVEQIALHLLDEAGENLIHKIDTGSSLTDDLPIVVFNTLMQPRSGLVKTEMCVPAAWVGQGQALAVRTPDGQIVNSRVEILKQAFREDAFWPELEVAKIQVRFYAEDMPPFGFRTYHIAPDEEARPPKPDSDLKVLKNGMENRYLRATFNSNGTLNLIDKESGQQLPMIHYFEDAADTGDEYDYSWLEDDKPIRSTGLKADVALVEETSYQIVYEVKWTLPLPVSLTPDRRRRSDETINMPVRTLVKLEKNKRRLDFETELVNSALDHRLRVVFPVPIKCDHVFAGSKFDIVKRSLKLPEGKGWVQPPQPTAPQDSFLALQGKDLGVSFILDGLPEYEVRDTPAGGKEYCLTLLRAVGWLSRGDLKTRRCNAGPPIPAPEAQCLRPFRFRYAVSLYKGTWQDHQTPMLVDDFNVPLQAVVHRHSYLDYKGPQEVDPELSMIQVQPEGLIVTAIKKAERGDKTIIRLWNPTDRTIKARLTCCWSVKEAHAVRLSERAVEALPVKDGAVEIELQSKKIAAVGFLFDRLKLQVTKL